MALRIILKSIPDSPDMLFVEIENEQGKSVSFPMTEEGRYHVITIGPAPVGKVTGGIDKKFAGI